MLRLLVISSTSLASFFGFLSVLSWLTESDKFTVLGASLLAFVGLPLFLLHFWRAQDPGSRCPGGKGLYPECLYVVTVSPREVRVTHPTRAPEAVAFADLVEVQIVTNDAGPFDTDVWWLLVGRKENTGCSFPGGASGEKDVLEMMQTLPGFNNEMFIQAMGSTSHARFTCWRAVTDPVR
jgi:hypothetical protein